MAALTPFDYAHPTLAFAAETSSVAQTPIELSIEKLQSIRATLHNLLNESPAAPELAARAHASYASIATLPSQGVASAVYSQYLDILMETGKRCNPMTLTYDFYIASRSGVKPFEYAKKRFLSIDTPRLDQPVEIRLSVDTQVEMRKRAIETALTERYGIRFYTSPH